MKTAKSFARRVRSKSPFRRRQRAETLIAELHEKELAFARQLHRSSHQTSQPGDQAEIEVVLEFSSSDAATATASPTQSDYSCSAKNPPRKVDEVPEIAPSSPTRRHAPTLTNAQAAACRFMERQQRLAAGNRRKGFVDRFMRPAKSGTVPPPPPSPAKSTNQMGITVRGRDIASKSISHPGRTQDFKTQERGRSMETSTRGGLSIVSKGQAKASRSSSRIGGGVTATMDALEPDEPILRIRQKGGIERPVAIDVAVQSRVSELSAPAAIIRQESLGNESIKGVRQALQKMEMELAAAGDAGKRVPRDKIMNALNYMANALHYDNQKEALVKELDAWIDESVVDNEPKRVDAKDDANDSDDYTSYSDEGSGSSFDLDAIEDGRSTASSRNQRQPHGAFPDLFQRLGKFFAISEDDKTAVRQAFDDLLWTEQVGSRRVKRSLRAKHDDCSESSADSIGSFGPLTCSIEDPTKQEPAETRGRSWWRRQGMDSGSVTSKKVMETFPLTASKRSLPLPTSNVNLRSSKSSGRGNAVSSGSGGKSSAGTRSPRATPQSPQMSALKECTPTSQPKTRFMMDEIDSDWNSFDDTTSEFWRQGDRYIIPSQPQASTRQAQLVNQYKLYHPPFWQDSDPFFGSDFLESPKEEDDLRDWDSCLHPAENLSHI